MEKKFNDENDILQINEEYEKIEIDNISASKTGLQKIDQVSKQDIKTLVKLYYETQRLRIIASAYTVADKKNSEDLLITNAFSPDAQDYKIIEKNIENQLMAVCKSQEVGRWLLGICGIGPVLAAGLLSYFDVTKANYASNFVSYAGLNDQNRPWLGAVKSKEILDEILKGRTNITEDDVYMYAVKTQWKFSYLYENAYNEKTKKWSKSNLIKAASKIPYNKELKTLLWKVACSIEYSKNRERSLYGKIFNERMTYEMMKNERGQYKDVADWYLSNFNFGKETNAYKFYIEGKLPPAHIRARVFRYVEKMLVCHLFVEMYRVEYDKLPPNPYIIDHSSKHNIIIPPEIPYTSVTGETPHYVNINDIVFFESEYKAFLTEEEFDDLEQVKFDFKLKNGIIKLKEPKQKYPKAKDETTQNKTIEEPVVEAPKKRRGRPPKNSK